MFLFGMTVKQELSHCGRRMGKVAEFLMVAKQKHSSCSSCINSIKDSTHLVSSIYLIVDGGNYWLFLGLCSAV